MVLQPRCIRQLSTSVINKIAAGEVIERPASVLKELLENAVDSGADRIEARLERGGCDRVRISDNGCGIPADELPLALASHATSKIETADDLFAVATLGFRGEALASIAEVSQLTLRSRVHTASEAYEITVNGGLHGALAPCAAAPGTSVDVKNLFFNTPVRRKFMRATQTELGHATEAFMRVVLAYPQIQFSLFHNDRLVYDLPQVESWRERIATLFGAEVAESLIWVENDDDNLRLSGFVANPTQSRSHNRMQYLFLNGRHIRDRALQHALGEAYRGLLLTGRFPISFLRLELPPDQIDVNVHPTKLEVRFQDSGQIYSQLLQVIRGRFLATDLTARVQTPMASGQAMAPTPAEAMTVPARRAADVRDQVRQWARGDETAAIGSADRAAEATSSPPAWEADTRATPVSVTDASPLIDPSFAVSRPQQAAFRFDRREDPPFVPFPHRSTASGHPANQAPVDPHRVIGPAPGATSLATSVRPATTEKVQAIQAHQRYLVTSSEEGLIVIDQHALHERILYEQFREKVLSGAVEIQRLLTPEPVDLSPTEAAAVLQHRVRLAELGLEVDGFGGATVLVQGYPAMLGKVNPGQLLRQIAEQLQQADRLPERRDVLDELLHLLACKAAVKAGDPLTGPEIAALLEYRHLVQDAHHCPHGRPTTLVFTREELDRRFKRI